MLGIVTPYKVVNYGTKLQAYAMQQLMSKYDDVELLGFVPATDKRIGSILGKVYLKLSRKFQKKSTTTQINELKKRAEVINQFDSNYQFGRIIKGNEALKQELKKYKAIVCGSDQLWAPSNVIADYFTLTIIPDEINKFSYASSFGISQIPNNMIGRYRKFLSRLDYISVREEQGKEIVKSVAGKDAEVVLDPTLMLDEDEWSSLAAKSKINVEESYIFCYFLGETQAHRDFARELAKVKSLKLVTIPHFKGWNIADEDFGDIQVYEAGPIEFLNLIKHAVYVCTDSFHSTVFSIIFKRQVAVFERFKKGSSESTNSRIYTILTNLGLEDQLYNDEKDIEKFISNIIDFSQVSIKLDGLKNKSFAYLDKAIGSKRR